MNSSFVHNIAKLNTEGDFSWKHILPTYDIKYVLQRIKWLLSSYYGPP